ncbi:hypothetical protein QBC37DRAFT_439009 [Rhypophila decipiens]|uniref:Gag1-like clamp domain-containing protein n=1 Tax=Rhypophila decipiens TaxID=261697 RepID=A0AAN6YBE1_9PEZI|nr:hypothetical protein QBC37DRAFT_439009 [Rhypophila decipiens]
MLEGQTPQLASHSQSTSQAIKSEFNPHLSTPLPTMIFSDLYKSPRSPFNKLKHSIPSVTLPATDLEADLISRDKTRQKEAVKKFLNEKIRCDWEFTWPPTPGSGHAPAAPHTDEKPESSSTPAQDESETGAKIGDASASASGDPSTSVSTASPVLDQDAPRDPGEEADSESDAGSVYSAVSEDQLHFHPRIEWTSDISDDDVPAHMSSPFRFDNPDAVGTAVQMSINERKARRRRAVREEMSWNTGLACFEARRNAWTGAKTVRVKPKPATPMSPSSSTRRLSFWRHHRSESTASQHGAFSPGSPPIASPLSPVSTHTSQHASLAQTASETESSNASKVHSASSRDRALYPVETLIPVPPPLLPPQNPMRASVTPSIYPSLYDKIVVHSLQPSCPVNLGDMLRACVVGWKRDGEWPPKSTIQAAPMPSAAEVMAIRQQRKAAQAQQKHARKASTATNGTSRRLSFVGFLGGASKNAEKPATIHAHHEEKDGAAGKETHSDDAKSGGSGKGIRRSLQKVFSFGQHGQHDSHAHPVAHADGAAISPTKGVTAAG